MFTLFTYLHTLVLTRLPSSCGESLHLCAHPETRCPFPSSLLVPARTPGGPPGRTVGRDSPPRPPSPTPPPPRRLGREENSGEKQVLPAVGSPLLAGGLEAAGVLRNGENTNGKFPKPSPGRVAFASSLGPHPPAVKLPTRDTGLGGLPTVARGSHTVLSTPILGGQGPPLPNSQRPRLSPLSARRGHDRARTQSRALDRTRPRCWDPGLPWCQ